MVLAVLLSASMMYGQEKKLYDPAADAAAGIAMAVKKASAADKFVLLMAGGNWCGWCVDFDRFCKADRKIDSILDQSFILYHLNWSKENENRPIFARYGYPQRFGFPVLLVLNGEGKLIHTQNSEYLEDGKKSYNARKVFSFFEQWSPRAVYPATYEK